MKLRAPRRKFSDINEEMIVKYTLHESLNPAMQTSVDEVTIIQQKDRMGSDSIMIQVRGELNLYGNPVGMQI